MKIQTTRKIIISSLALLSGAALAGSVTGTVAWFQYATRAQVAYTGTTAHCSKMLQISVDDGDDDPTNNVWGTDIKSSQLPDPAFPPITSGPLEKDAPLEPKERVVEGQFEEDGVTPKKIYSPFYADPNVRQGLYDNWLLASENSYSQFTILIKVKDVDGNYASDNPTYLENDVFLTDLTIQDAGDEVTNLSDAIRVHFAIESPGEEPKYMLFAKDVTSTDVGGFLDMNNDGVFDSIRGSYEFDEYEPCLYGGADGEPDFEYILDSETSEKIGCTQITNPLKQTSYVSDDANIIASEDDMGQLSGGTALGTTSATDGEFLKITITMWLEGWCDSLIGIGDSSSQSSIWNTDEYIQKSFNVGMTFGVKLHSSDE